MRILPINNKNTSYNVKFKQGLKTMANKKTPLMIEQHIHGAYGVDFNRASSTYEILFVAERLLKLGIGGFFPTLVTDSVENIKRQIEVIKNAAKQCPRILGIHLEGIFINPEKRGIQNPEHFLPLTVENYKLIEDDFIKIVTLAPELNEGLIDYLRNKGIKVQAGHCIGSNLSNVDGVTHVFNAMAGITHRGKSTALSALIDDNLYTEIIADGVHVNDDALKLLFKAKPEDKVILVSDALPITNSDIKEAVFADSKISYDGTKATSANGTLAGSTTMLDKIVKRLGYIGLFNPQYIKNAYTYHGLEPKGEITWDEEWNIVDIKEEGQ